jgi:hypothetical protein
MPKRSEREIYGDIFDQNPFEDIDPKDMYRSLRWGNEPSEIFDIDSPEPLATIGDLARLKLSNNDLKWDESEAPFLAVGRDSNALYIIPRDEKGNPLDIPDEGFHEVENVKQTDYYSDKGGEDCYYFHKHENPYPTLLIHKNGVAIIVPRKHNKRRSYAVGKEGIVG